MSKPIQDWITIDEARQRLSDMHHVAVSRESVKHACQRFRLHVENRASDREPIPAGTEVERRKREVSAAPRELRCTWFGSGRHILYLVDPDALSDLKLRWPADVAEPGKGTPGRRVGGPRSIGLHGKARPKGQAEETREAVGA